MILNRWGKKMGPNDKKVQAEDVLLDEEEQELLNEDLYIDSLIAIYTNDNCFDIDDDENLYSSQENLHWDE